MLATGATNSSPVLQLDDNGVLMGVSGLSYVTSPPDYPWYGQENKGLLYDVSFKPGTFGEAFELSADVYEYTGHHYPYRSNQELMLFDLFSPGGAGHAYTIDDNLLINGCDFAACMMYSFYQYPDPSPWYLSSPVAFVAIKDMPVESGGSNWVDTQFPAWSWDDKGGADTWAVWSLSEPQVSVPEPTSLLLLLTALPLLMFGRRRWRGEVNSQRSRSVTRCRPGALDGSLAG
ncbi:MAG: PEP-CTERM sorting domain-containing protein [Natronospirillum sp.]